MDERELEDAMTRFAEHIVDAIADDYDPYEVWDGEDD